MKEVKRAERGGNGRTSHRSLLQKNGNDNLCVCCESYGLCLRLMPRMTIISISSFTLVLNIVPMVQVEGQKEGNIESERSIHATSFNLCGRTNVVVNSHACLDTAVRLSEI